MDIGQRTVEWPTNEVVAKDPAHTAIVVVNYNTAELISQLIWSAYRTLGGDGFGTMVVVDNGSADGSAQILSALAAADLIDYLPNDANRYHGPALNQAVDHLAETQSHATTPIGAVWVLDSDCVVVRSDTLWAATAVMTETDASLVGQPRVDQWSAGAVLELHSLLVDPARVWRRGIEPFQEHGEPSRALQLSCQKAGLRRATFPFAHKGYVIHLGRGTLAAVVDNDERANRYHEWAKEHNEPHYAGETDAPAVYRALHRAFRAAVPELSPEAVVRACLADGGSSSQPNTSSIV